MKRFKDFLIWSSLGLFMLSGVLLIVAMSMESDVATPNQQEAITAPATETEAVAPTETFPPSTPLPTLTPSQTLRPPPTFEPPTMTPQPSLPPSATPTEQFQVGSDLEGVHGLETPTPSTTPGCEVRKDWTLIYEVQAQDALERIAQQYGTTSWALAEANCLDDANVIYLGQRLRVPGEAHPEDVIECVPWEVFTPMNGAVGVDPNGTMTFNWRGPRAPRNLIRVFNDDGENVFEVTVDMRQNETIVVPDKLPDEGIYTWYVYPLSMDFVQIDCLEGGPWWFYIGSGD